METLLLAMITIVEEEFDFHHKTDPVATSDDLDKLKHFSCNDTWYQNCGGVWVTDMIDDTRFFRIDTIQKI